ncbi:two-component system response regulator [Teredinibacter waterburyi]|jgi:PAS domain S-box/diguanylate cyclase (GGDEF) domain|uniref:two-component system response regulator n=1 Tax=Teredinibacter waterburyi TaxID=1500538 RepID=UPI00165FACF0|nr:EAL domain-containing protein [Teredinibacter waterburyi]
MSDPVTILVVDDDDATRLMIETTLENAGFSAIGASCCADARILFKNKNPDLILLDVRLPDGNGFDLCREFLATRQCNEIPIAMVTGLDDIDSIKQGYDSGATDFITKPVNWGALPYHVHYLLRANRALADLSLSESKNRALLSGIPDMILRIHRDGRVLDVQAGSYASNVEAWRMLGEDGSSGSDSLGEFRLPEEIVAATAAGIAKCFDVSSMQYIEFQWTCGSVAAHFWEARILPRDRDEVLMVLRDITQRKSQESQLQLWAKVFESSNEAIFITDSQFNIISVNRSYEKIMGFGLAEVLGLNSLQMGVRLHSHSFLREIKSELIDKGCWQGEISNQRKSGGVFPCWLSITRVLNDAQEVEHYIAIFNDITESKNSREQIEFLAHHDSLTGLPNRLVLNDRLDVAITEARRRNEKIGVLFIDLDRFKNVNDSLGHGVGDEILKEAGARLSRTVRDSDTVSRLGGDEFVVLIPKLQNEGRLADVTIKLSKALQEPYDINGMGLHMTPSIGIAVYPEDGDNSVALIKNADAAMYLAKERGRNNYQFYKPALNAKTLDRLKLESDLRESIELEQFELFYQPQIAGKTGLLWGAEALIRWRHPVRGLVSPAEFIPLAEETGLIVALGEWVIKDAARQIRYWRDIGFTNMSVSVNLSALQFRQLGLVETVKQILREAGVPPSSMEIELTESMLMGDVDTAIATLQQFRASGFRIAIDDFGTGFSCMNYLRHLPIDILKIDQSFVREMLTEPESRAIVQSIITLAHALGKETIAEGVETAEEYQLLLDEDCRFIQGYYVAKPMPAVEFTRWYTDWHSQIHLNIKHHRRNLII